MFYARYRKLMQGLALVVMSLGLVACNDLSGDLLPSGEDKRPSVVAGSIGYMPTQVAADFTIPDSLDNDFTLSDNLTGGTAPADIVVLYFTMWCPICMQHTDHMYNHIIPEFDSRGTIVWGLVDYVSGSVTGTRLQELASGYSGSRFTVLSDVNQAVMNQLHGSMGIVVVLDADGTILMNEDYRDGAELRRILNRELP